MFLKFFIIGTVLAGVSNLFFGTLVFSKDRKNLTNIAFLFLSLAFTLWTAAYAVWLGQVEAVQALFWARMLNLGATFIPVFFMHWIISFLGLATTKKWLIRFAYLTTIIFALQSFSPLYITSVKEVAQFSFWPQAGPLYVAFLLINFFGFFGYAIFLLLRRMRQASILEDK